VTAKAPPAGNEASDAPRAEGVAGKFRRERERRRRPRTVILGAIVVLVVVMWGVYVLLTPRGAGSYSPPSNLSQFRVLLGTPSVVNLTCEGSSTPVVAEVVPWVHASGPVATWEIVLLVTQVVDTDMDGDYISSSGPAPTVTASSPCVDAPPGPGSTNYNWYVLLSNTTGAYAVYYSYVAFDTLSGGWLSVSNGSSNVTIANDSTLTLISTPPLVDSGYDLEVTGVVSGSSGNFGWVPL